MKIRKVSTRNSILTFLFVFVVQVSFAQRQTNPSNALQHYIHNGDTTFHWIVKDSFSINNVKGYDLLMISQQWRQYTWKHQLTILSPKKNNYDGALLYIGSGHNDKATQKPHFGGPGDDLTREEMCHLAAKNHAIVSIIHQVPNEPLFDSMMEDQIISYTFHRFQKDTNDYTWPLLFPMVKSVVRAMDAIQYFAKNKLKHPVYRFVVAGESKRGWTTWLTGANDPRVAAIAPMSIDVVNMPVNLAHQLKAYGNYSVEIQDFVRLGVIQGITSPSGGALIKMVDPYSYRKRLPMPKMIIVGSNDPYWVIDNIKNYLPEIPGYNLVNYTPNAGHELDSGKVALPALSAFFGITMARGKYPLCSWKTKENGKRVKLKVKSSKDILLGVKVWHSDSKDMDFRKDKFFSRDLHIRRTSDIQTMIKFPSSGYRAFFMALTYKDPNGGKYTVCTQAFMTDTRHIL